MTRKISLLFMFILLASCVETGISPAQYYAIPEEKIPSMQDKALHGDGQASFSLARYYTFTKPDAKRELYWLKISAQEGNPSGMYSYGASLSEQKNTKDRKNARYWLKKAEATGDANTAPLAASVLKRMDEEDKNPE